LIYLNYKHFGLKRAGYDHRSLNFNQVAIVNIDGKRAVKYTEDINKWTPGALKRVRLQSREMAFFEDEQNTERCHVRLLEKYIAVRPYDAEPFYLQPLKKFSETTWFSVQPVGHNSISKVISEIHKAAKLHGQKSQTKELNDTPVKIEILSDDEDGEDFHGNSMNFNGEEEPDIEHESYSTSNEQSGSRSPNQFENWPSEENSGNVRVTEVNLPQHPKIAEQDFHQLNMPTSAFPVTSSCPEFGVVRNLESWKNGQTDGVKGQQVDVKQSICEMTQAKKQYFQRLLEMAEEEHIAKLAMFEAKRKYYTSKMPRNNVI